MCCVTTFHVEIASVHSVDTLSSRDLAGKPGGHHLLANSTRLSANIKACLFTGTLVWDCEVRLTSNGTAWALRILLQHPALSKISLACSPAGVGTVVVTAYTNFTNRCTRRLLARSNHEIMACV